MLLRFKNLIKIIVATTGLLLIMGFVARAVAADDDLPLPEEVQMESGGKPPIPPPADTAGGVDLNVDAAAGQNTPASAQTNAPPMIQNAEVISFIDSLNFGKEQFAPNSAFRKEGQLSSRVVK